jgi:NDP-sugar pyrophosphorylase family protein
MRAKGIHHLPVLDGQGRAVSVLTTSDMTLTACPNRVVLMAGGKGTRMRPLTDSLPKPMLQVAGRPMLQITLERCIESGIRRFTMAVNHLSSVIMDYFGDGSEWGVEIEYIVESEPLGTAGALGQLNVEDGTPIVVMNGDVLSRVDVASIIRFHMEVPGTNATVCGRVHEVHIPYGVLAVSDSSLTAIHEKPYVANLVNAGIYVLNCSVVASLKSGERIDMTQVLSDLVQGGKSVRVFPIHEYWIDAGQPAQFEQAQADWKAADSSALASQRSGAGGANEMVRNT